MPRVDLSRVPRAATAVVVATAGVGLALLLGGSLPAQYVFLGTSAVVAAITLIGLGVVTGSAGMISLCQMAFAVVGAWVVSWLNLHDAPGGPVLWMLAGGVLAGVAGILVGLPALRLRGVNLAVVTLGFAAAVHLTITQLQFPGAAKGVRVLRPGIASTDREFFTFAVVVLIGCALVVWALSRSRIGSGWRAVSYSERGTAGAGGSVRTTKLSAFAVGAALAGISGGLLTLQVGFASPGTFAPLSSLALYVLAVVTGSYLIDMAVFGGVLWVAIPEILKQFGVPQDWAFIVFGLTGIQAITSRSNVGETVRTVWRRRRRAVTAGLSATGDEDNRRVTALVPDSAAVVLQATDVTVRFGTVTALDSVSLTVREREIIALIGPNGAGKSTFIDTLTGFLPRHDGVVSLDGRSLGSASPTARARRGLRRTFQQDRVPPGLTVDGYLRFVARRRVTATEIDDILSFFQCPPRATPLAVVDVGTRRIIEIAAHLLSRPRVLLLDEPAAGLSHEAHLALGDRLAQVPERFDTAVLLIEHDLDLVRRVCPRVVVLDFGRVLTDGPQQDVLSDPRVLGAYMGDKEML